jgi:hypothetical protein
MTTFQFSRLFARRLAVASLCPAALFGLACRESTEGRVPVYPARGQVLFKGKPLADALVVLRPADASGNPGIPQPTGRTDQEGKFRLHTYIGDDGAPPGSYLVGVSISPEYSETRDLMKNALNADSGKFKFQPPSKKDGPADRYQYPEKSKLTAEIKKGENEIPPLNLD